MNPSTENPLPVLTSSRASGQRSSQACWLASSTAQPAAVGATVGSSVSHSVATSGSAQSYQWYRDATAIGGVTVTQG